MCWALLGAAGCGGAAGSSSTAAPTHSSVSTAASTAGSPSAPTSQTPVPPPAASGSAGPGGGGPAVSKVSPLARYYGTIATFGSVARGSDREAILAALDSYLSAIATGQWATACDQLYTPIRRQVQTLLSRAGTPHRSGCSAGLAALLGRTPSSLRERQELVRVLDVRASGDRAFVLYRSVVDPHAMVSMFREAGRWKAGVLAGATPG